MHDALAALGRPLGGEPPRTLVGAGFGRLNPAVVTVALVPLAGGRTRVEVTAVAKEGLLRQRPAAKAVGRVLDELGAGRRTPRR